MAGQYLGAFVAALVLWGEYADVIKLAEATQVSRRKMKSTNHDDLSQPRIPPPTVG